MLKQVHHSAIVDRKEAVVALGCRRIAAITLASALLVAVSPLAGSTALGASYTYVHYCTDCFVNQGSYVASQNGGYDKNYWSYGGTGTVYGEELGLNLRTNSYDSDRAPYNLYNFNSVGDLCSDWYGGVPLRLYDGNVHFSHTISATGRYENGDAGCP